MTTRERIAAFLPGWRLDSVHSEESDGSLVTMQRCPDRLMWRTFWLTDTGATEARVDRLGYIVDAEGRKLA